MVYISQSVHIQENQVIFSEGDPGDCAYIIEKGRVLVFVMRDNIEVPLSVLGVGEIFGEMSLIDNQIRNASVRALEEVTLSIITKQQIFERISKADSVVQLLVRVLLKRIRTNNKNSGQIESSIPTVNIEEESAEVGEQKIKIALDQLQLENQIFSAFQNNEFQLYYQPIVELKNRRIVGCEALLRWNSPIKGLIPPDYFIDVIENSSMVIPIGQWIINQALTDLKRIRQFLITKGQDKLANDFMMSINISGRQFSHSEFVKNLEETRLFHNLPTKNVKLEMTERIMMNGEIALSTLHQCRNKGYSISIDDFGTGFSSLKYLAEMPISFLKIDRSFVMKILKDQKSRAVVTSVIYLAKAINVEIIAEGIETNEECIVLEMLGSQFGQGYLFARPMPVESFLSLV